MKSILSKAFLAIVTDHFLFDVADHSLYSKKMYCVYDAVLFLIVLSSGVEKSATVAGHVCDQLDGRLLVQVCQTSTVWVCGVYQWRSCLVCIIAICRQYFTCGPDLSPLVPHDRPERNPRLLSAQHSSFQQAQTSISLDT
jgi:hypothetical protein